MGEVPLYALTPNTVELIRSLGALPPRGGPVQDPALTLCLSGTSKGQGGERVWDVGFIVMGCWRVSGSGFRVSGLEFRV